MSRFLSPDSASLADVAQEFGVSIQKLERWRDATLLQTAAILAVRHQVYERARQRHPSRWRRHTRNWQPIGAVTLNPERDAVVEGIQLHHEKQRLAA